MVRGRSLLDDAGPAAESQSEPDNSAVALAANSAVTPQFDGLLRASMRTSLARQRVELHNLRSLSITSANVSWTTAWKP